MLSRKRRIPLWLFAAVLLLLISATTAHAAADSTAKKYDKMCDKIVTHAKLAAAAHNGGQFEEASKHTRLAEQAFKSATALQPKEPQAFVNWAIFLTNSKRYEESLSMFETALDLVGNDRQSIAQIESSMKRTKYETFSMRRDKAYGNASGNVTEAHQWGLLQLALSPDPHITMHQIATMETMLCESNQSMCESATTRFRIAATSAHGRYTLERMPSDPRLRLDCTHSRMHIGSWASHRDVRVTRVPGVLGLFIQRVDAPVIIVGRDGVVTFPLDSDCSVLSPSSDYFLNMAENLARDPQGIEFNAAMELSALSLVQFAGASFYHWMAEAVPRLVVAKKYWKDFDNAGLNILVPVLPDGSIPKFIVDTFQNLFSSWNIARRVVPYTQRLRIQGGYTFVSWDEQPCPPEIEKSDSSAVVDDGDGEEVKEGPQAASKPLVQRHCASLAHADALRITRQAIYDALNEKKAVVNNDQKTGKKKTPYLLLAMRGKHASNMRSFNESVLFSKITNLVKTAAGVPFNFGVRSFSESPSLPDALELFRGASVVVGAHGGALSNIIACANGTSVIEIGFTAPAAQHFHHMANALGLRYHRVKVNEDPLGRGMAAPEINFDTNEVLRTILRIIRDDDDSSGSSSGGSGSDGSLHETVEEPRGTTVPPTQTNAEEEAPTAAPILPEGGEKSGDSPPLAADNLDNSEEEEF